MGSSEPPPLVRLDGVSHRFGRAEVLTGLSLTIEPGDIYGLLGLNGAGKTTAIRILLGLLRPTAGRVELFGLSAERARRSIAGRVGATIEGPAFYPHLSGEVNLALLHRLGGGAGRGPREALEIVGLADAAGMKARKYSMGMLQRLAIAQALLGRPELLVLDEPTSNLDPKGILEVRQLIQRLNRDCGVTVLLSSHQLAEAEGLCNRVAILHRGRKIEESAVEALFESEQSAIEIELDRPERAVEFLRTQEGVTSVDRVNGRVRARLRRSDRAALNARLIGEGFAVSELRERRPTLEDYFHERIAADDA